MSNAAWPGTVISVTLSDGRNYYIRKAPNPVFPMMPYACYTWIEGVCCVLWREQFLSKAMERLGILAGCDDWVPSEMPAKTQEAGR